MCVLWSEYYHCGGCRTRYSGDDELADEADEVSDLVDHGHAHDVTDDQTERHEGGAAEVLAVDSTLQTIIEHVVASSCLYIDYGTNKHVCLFYTINL